MISLIVTLFSIFVCVRVSIHVLNSFALIRVFIREQRIRSRGKDPGGMGR